MDATVFPTPDSKEASMRELSVGEKIGAMTDVLQEIKRQGFGRPPLHLLQRGAEEILRDDPELNEFPDAFKVRLIEWLLEQGPSNWSQNNATGQQAKPPEWPS